MRIFERIMIWGAHPEDESSMGGTIAAQAAAGGSQPGGFRMAAETQTHGVLGHEHYPLVLQPPHGGGAQGVGLDRGVGREAVDGFGFGMVLGHGRD